MARYPPPDSVRPTPSSGPWSDGAGVVGVCATAALPFGDEARLTEGLSCTFARAGHVSQLLVTGAILRPDVIRDPQRCYRSVVFSLRESKLCQIGESGVKI
jgi:hypothetical protein